MAPRGRRGQPPDRLARRGGGGPPPRTHRHAGSLSELDATHLARARGYPFEIVPGSFRLGSPDAEPGPRRLLAYGANRSAAGIARKLGTDAPRPPVVVAAARLAGFDVVYSAHVSPYGAVPATLQRRSGHAVDVHVLHLDDAQVAAIDAYEPNYQRRRLEDVSLRLADGTLLEAAEAYISLHGCLALDGAACAIAHLDQHAILTLVRDRLAPDQDLDEFILAGIRDPALQASRTAELRADAIPFD